MVEILGDAEGGEVFLEGLVEGVVALNLLLLEFLLVLRKNVIEEEVGVRLALVLSLLLHFTHQRTLQHFSIIRVEVSLVLSLEVFLQLHVHIRLLADDQLLFSTHIREFGLAELLDNGLLEVGEEFGGVGVGEFVQFLWVFFSRRVFLFDGSQRLFLGEVQLFSLKFPFH